ncbi:MAG: M1 family metallopeptidase [Planctomycetota bacterium]
MKTSTLLAVACLATTAFAQDRPTLSFGRPVAPPPDKTIFAPLDLPTPTSLRTASGAPGADYWQQEANYAIQVALDTEHRLVKGREHVVYVNHSPDPLDYIWVHLEQNVLRADSIGSRIGGGNAVGGPSEVTDGVRVLDVSGSTGPLEHHVFDTMMRVELPAPLAPKSGRLEFDVAWEFEVPKQVFRRYGTLQTSKGTVWEIAQWFPAVAVYDDVHGWNTLPYIGTGEFYMNYGTFDVRITVPHDHLVVATGVLQNEDEVYTQEQRQRLDRARKSEETVIVRGKDEVGDKSARPAGDAPITWHFRAEKVRTFAWASSEAFILDAAALDDKLIQSAYTEEDEKTWSKSTQMLRAAIAGYSRRWFPYPYPVATNVAGVEGGMEYPMIIFCRGRNERGLYGVTTHEIGHNWFPMTVNTDERRHAWMDEGFNTFINGYSAADYFGDAGQASGRGPAGRGMGRAGAMLVQVPIMREADQLTGMSLGMLEYQKTGTALRLLREYVLGEERFDYAFRTYVRRWAFKSPRPADFFRCMEDAAGADLAWFWRGWFVEAANLDQSVEGVRQDGSTVSMEFGSLDRMVMPLRYELTFADGSTERHELPVQAWFAGDKFTERVAIHQPVTKVVVDPDRVLPDRNRDNNTWQAGEKDK